MILYSKETDFLEMEKKVYMSNYLKNKHFVIENYDKKKPFASFLPGIAGLRGIPLWAFYVNRGQGISSFGVTDKNGAILEFFPANCAYMYIDRIGFRTFVKVDGEVEELFKTNNPHATRSMEIGSNDISYIETNFKLNLKIKITYLILPNEKFASLVRNVKIEDLTKTKRNIEVIDGLCQILPSGIDYGGYKAVSNLLRSWMEVDNLDHNIAYYKLRSSTSDSAVVETVHDGNFYLSFVNHKLIKPITDCDLIFDYDTSLSEPIYFKNHSLKHIYSQKQITQNKVACGFCGLEWNTLNPLEINTLIGYTKDIDLINEKASEIISENYLHYKMIEASYLVNDLTNCVKTKTAIPIFDEYIRQNYLDNSLRGGHPLVFEGDDKNVVYHVYSRKHGDLERDYNFFTINPEYYSQGNGNFRDVCQNRRNDVLINPKVKDFNIHLFGSLIQSDGYNPLGINGSTFLLNDNISIKQLIGKTSDRLEKVLSDKYTIGKVISVIEEEALFSFESLDEVIKKLLINSEQLIEVDFGEGYWQDHWTYILDLVESYLTVYPDCLIDLLFTRNDYKIYSSPAYVLPRSDKYVLSKSKQVRQYDAIIHDHEKVRRNEMKSGSNWLKDQEKREVQTNLYSKLFILAVNKYCCLDPQGIGISYEANKPGWNDAMNGVPGLFGSGVGEAIELYRLLTFLEKHNMKQILNLPSEFVSLVDDLKKDNLRDSFTDWDHRMTALENYRKQIRFNTDSMKMVDCHEILDTISFMRERVLSGLKQIYQQNDGILPTYLLYEATSYETLYEDGHVKMSSRGLENVKVKSFKQIILPSFLEAPARALKTNLNVDMKALYKKIKQSDMYDRDLKFYKTSGDLSEVTLETGRIVAFTKGWFERESNFLHMTYKYLYGLLKAKMYHEFFDEIKTNFVCFMNSDIYGRSILENSSFLAPSNNPNPTLHGKGFVARLSGSTAEVLSMWHLMMFGHEIFSYENQELVFKLEPVLSSEFFGDDGIVTAYLFGQIEVNYINLRKLNTFDQCATVTKMEIFSENDVVVVDGGCVKSKLAYQIRDGYISKINIHIN